MQTQCELAADPQAPAAARDFALKALERMLDDPAPSTFYDDVQLVVSELVTNAVRAGSPRVGLAVAMKRRRVVIEVSDAAVGWPEQRRAEIAEPGGRGLPLVDVLSDAWGVRGDEPGRGGKVVWAELAVPVG
jgi:anti-sigma regulatory factor (Ser/Thr protein kinase)